MLASPTANPLIVYEISPVDSDGNLIFTEPYNCNFTGADGTVTHLGGEQDIIPERQVSVTCFGPSSLSSTASPATSTTISSATKSVTNIAPSTATSAAGNRPTPPYPNAAQPSSKTSTATASFVSAGSSGTISATAGTGSGAVPFTGDAPKAGSMSCGSFLAFVGLIIAAL